MARYAEVMPKGKKMRNALTGEEVIIGEIMQLAPRQTLLLEAL